MSKTINLDHTRKTNRRSSSRKGQGSTPIRRPWGLITQGRGCDKCLIFTTSQRLQPTSSVLFDNRRRSAASDHWTCARPLLLGTRIPRTTSSVDVRTLGEKTKANMKCLHWIDSGRVAAGSFITATELMNRHNQSIGPVGRATGILGFTTYCLGAISPSRHLGFLLCSVFFILKGPLGS